jgi:hypothetical protein
MYCVKRTMPCFDEVEYTHAISYYTYDGWSTPTIVSKNGYTSKEALTLTGVVLFTEGERKANTLRPNEEWQWYGAYKR